MPAMPDPNQIKDILTSMQETLENLGVWCLTAVKMRM